MAGSLIELLNTAEVETSNRYRPMGELLRGAIDVNNGAIRREAGRIFEQMTRDIAGRVGSLSGDHQISKASFDPELPIQEIAVELSRVACVWEFIMSAGVVGWKEPEQAQWRTIVLRSKDPSPGIEAYLV